MAPELTPKVTAEAFREEPAAATLGPKAAPSWAVKVPPPTETDAIKILFGIKERYEKFHAVTYTDDAVNFSVAHSNRYIPDRFLPDKAIDLIDEAGARVKLRHTSLPDEITEVQKRIKFIVHRMENAIANH